jgi:hypothetical protein
MPFIISLFILIASLFISQPASADSQPASQPAISVPSAQLSYDSPTVDTLPAQVSPLPIGGVDVGSTVCLEDMPCWDCETMGNGDCSPAPAPATPATVDYCEEDEPCWDCNTMGNRICGSATASDAWASYDALSLSPDTHDALTVHYVETLPTEPHTDAMSDLEFALPSITDPTVWHVFSYAELTTI